MYMNTIYVGLTGLVGYVIAGALINALGSKNILSMSGVFRYDVDISFKLRDVFFKDMVSVSVYGLSIAGCCGLGLYWANSLLVTVILSSCYVSIGSICSTALIGVIVNMFPTSLR